MLPQGARYASIMGYNLQRTIELCDLFAQVGRVGMQDFSRLIHLCHYALEAQKLPGCIVEFGCHNGHTAKLLTAITDKTVCLYDSFQGLPNVGEKCLPGAMATTVESVFENFERNQLRYPKVKAGWFCDLKPDDLPAQIALAHLDGDLYCSTMDALKLVYPKMVPGGFILIDDYEEPYFEGPKRAAEEFMASRLEKIQVLSGPNGEKAYKALIVKR